MKESKKQKDHPSMMGGLYWWGIPTLFRCPHNDDLSQTDIGLVGVPHSTGNGTTERDQHLGPRAVKSARAYNATLPVLDSMQTMPAFVYLIPIIAFFGTGKPPGVLSTIIFGMPPVIRLTALGMRGVPANIIEAAIAFGASKRILYMRSGNTFGDAIYYDGHQSDHFNVLIHGGYCFAHRCRRPVESLYGGDAMPATAATARLP